MEITQKTYRVEGMHCASCVSIVEKALLELNEVSSAAVNLPLETVKLKFDSPLEFNNLKEKLESAGYRLMKESIESLSAKQEEEIQSWNKRLLWVALLGIPLLVYAMAEMFISKTVNPFSILFQLCLSTPIILISHQFYRNGMKSLFHLTPNMNSLVALGTGAAYVYSILSSINLLFNLGISGFEKLYFESAGVILVFITLGRYLEARAKCNTTKALLELFDNAPRNGWVNRDGEWLEVPVSEIKEKDRVMIKPGGQIPVDGVVLEGSSYVDESAITGEPLPVGKNVHDKLTGATINTSGLLIMEARQVGENTVYARIIQMVEDAQNIKAPIQSLADQVAAVFVPIVLCLAIISSIGWFLLGQSLVFAVNILISVLIIACPCALGLATPTAITVGTGIAAKLGIHFKSAEALQTMSEVDTIIFDKTGTLTLGKPRVVDFTSTLDEKEFIFYLASVENGSEHPLADAVMNLAKIQNIKVDKPRDLEAVSGRGIQGIVNEKKVMAGTLTWLVETGVHLPENKDEKVSKWEYEGKTVIHAAVDNNWIGMAAVSDTIRPESVEIIQQLNHNGLNLHLLTGDRKASGEHFAKQVAINNVHAEVLPHDKSDKVRELQKDGFIVAMVGDGINDAPALAAANIGMAIGSGTDVALETSDVVLMRDNLHSVFNSWQLSKRVVNKIKQNLFWAFAYNVVGIPIAMGLLYPFTGYLLNPMLAGAAMAFSSVSVVGNTLLLKKI